MTIRVDHLPIATHSRAFGYGSVCSRVVEPKTGRRCCVPVAQHRVDHTYDPITRQKDPHRFERAAGVFNLHDEGELCGHWIQPQERLCGLPKSQHVIRKTPKTRYTTFMMADGEGVSRDPHRYVMLCAADHRIVRKIPGPRKPRRLFVENERGLSTEECLQFLLKLPRGAKLSAFGAGYDLTKWLADLSDQQLYELNNPNLRTPPATEQNPYPRPDPVLWVGPSGEKYYLSLLQTRFTVYVRRKRTREDGRVVSFKIRRTLWDIFRFSNTSFVQTLEDWDVGLPKVRARIAAMKKRRGGIDWSWDDRESIRQYCLDECHLGARYFKKLDKLGKDNGTPLKSYFGAGSFAAALLKKLDVTRTINLDPTRVTRGVVQPERTEFARDLSLRIMQAFVGGRFENRVVGAVQGPIYNHDISSAYAAQLVYLPCLEHGGWARTTSRDRMLAGRAAICRYALGKAPRDVAWGPFPYREADGTIVYPKESGGGWVWRDEFLAGEALASNVSFVEAYVLESECECQPFAEIPTYYNRRLRLGKEGVGLVIKLQLASVYGKLAQNVGMHPFQCWVWAGMVTSGTRAELLNGIKLHSDPHDVLALATDGLLSLQRIAWPAPRWTGTEKALRSDKEAHDDALRGLACAICGTVGCRLAHKPLGGWETKVSQAGVFFAGLGRLWDLDKHGADLAGAIKHIRARGIGRNTLAAHVAEIRTAWAKGQAGITIPGKGPTEAEDHVRFRGMKSSVMHHRSQGTYSRAAEFGEWVPTDIRVSFEPLPKRTWPGDKAPRGTFGMLPGASDSARVYRGVSNFIPLMVRSMPSRDESCPYLPTSLSREALDLKAAQILQSEQPDPEDLGETGDI